MALVALMAAATGLGALALAPAAVAAGGGPIPPEYAMEQVLPPKKCANAGLDAGWKEHELVIATAIALAESGCDPKATGSNPPSESCPDGSLDRGAWQINSCWHPEVTDECAYKLKCNAEAAYDIYVESSHSFEPWTTWDVRSFRFWLSEARRGVKKVTGEKYVVGVVWTEGGALNIRKKPTSESDLVGTLADKSVIYIDCQKRGEEVYSPVFDYSTKWWDKLAKHQYVTNAYVDTDSTERVAHKC
jgi:hypothetical protein